jgi:hypothetical protein
MPVASSSNATRRRSWAGFVGSDFEVASLHVVAIDQRNTYTMTIRSAIRYLPFRLAWPEVFVGCSAVSDDRDAETNEGVAWTHCPITR